MFSEQNTRMAKSKSKPKEPTEVEVEEPEAPPEIKEERESLLGSILAF
jgi:hypothetical protein